MRRRKILIVVAAVAALTLAIAGSAYALAGNGPQGYLGGGENPGAEVSAQNGNAEGLIATGADYGDQERTRDQQQDPTSEDCPGTCDGLGNGRGVQGGGPQGGGPQGAGSEPVTLSRVQTQTQSRTGDCDGDCDQDQTLAQTQAQTRTQACDGECDPAQNQTATRQCRQEGVCDGEGPYGPGGPDDEAGPKTEAGSGAGAGPATAGGGSGRPAEAGSGMCDGDGDGPGGGHGNCLGR